MISIISLRLQNARTLFGGVILIPVLRAHSVFGGVFTCSYILLPNVVLRV